MSNDIAEYKPAYFYLQAFFSYPAKKTVFYRYLHLQISCLEIKLPSAIFKTSQGLDKFYYTACLSDVQLINFPKRPLIFNKNTYMFNIPLRYFSPMRMR